LQNVWRAVRLRFGPQAPRHLIDPVSFPGRNERFRSTLTGTVVQSSPGRNRASRGVSGFGTDVSGSCPTAAGRP